MKKVKTVTPEQKEMVQKSFLRLVPVGKEAATLFYKRLFELDPSLRPLFKIPIIEQERKFMDMLQIAVYGLDYPDKLGPAIRRLGERHIGYGIKPADFETLGKALFWMLELGLEDNFSPDIKAAWQAVYSLFVDLMV